MRLIRWIFLLCTVRNHRRCGGGAGSPQSFYRDWQQLGASPPGDHGVCYVRLEWIATATSGSSTGAARAAALTQTTPPSSNLIRQAGF